MNMFFGSPEELAAHMQEHANRNAMVHQDFTHSLRDFLEKLDKDELDLLDTVVMQAASNAHWAAYLRGQLTVLADKKFDVCPCGTDHDAEAAAAFGQPSGTVPPEGGAPKSSPDSVDTAPADPVESGVKPGLTGAARDAAMREYGLEQVNPAEVPDHPTGLRCINCHQVYVSLEDRMLREPGLDGCGGCQTKSAHGGWQGP